jgi:hypothetical protein
VQRINHGVPPSLLGGVAGWKEDDDVAIDSVSFQISFERCAVDLDVLDSDWFGDGNYRRHYRLNLRDGDDAKENAYRQHHETRCFPNHLESPFAESNTITRRFTNKPFSISSSRFRSDLGTLQPAIQFEEYESRPDAPTAWLKIPAQLGSGSASDLKSTGVYHARGPFQRGIRIRAGDVETFDVGMANAKEAQENRDFADGHIR